TVAKSAFPENHPLAVGMGGTSVSAGVAHFLPACDLLFSVGASLARTLGSTAIPPGKQMVQCTADERDLNVEYGLDGALLGDAQLVLREWCEEVRKQAGHEGRRGDETAAREVAEVRRQTLDEWGPKLTSNETPINPYRLIWDVMQTVDRAQ